MQIKGQLISTRTTKGFTRMELCAAAGALLLLAAVSFPALAGSKPSTDRAVCFNNLRLIGRALDIFMADHQERTPWRYPAANGGTFIGPGKPGAAWFEFSFLSNNMPHPRILACPADAGAKIATEFAGTSTSYITSGMRGGATSYTISLDSYGSANTALIVSTDRNLRFDGTSSCSAGVNNVSTLQRPPFGQAAWTNAVHINSGHVLRIDGSVIFTDNAQLRQALQTGDDNGNFHILPPR